MSALLSGACVSATFGVPSVFGARILSLEASLVTNYTASVPAAYRFTQPSTEAHNATFCNVTVAYTHPGQNDNILVEAWLPVENWNGRFQAVGGGGWVAGRFFLSYEGMKGAMADGYATVTTDAGLGSAVDAAPWALLSPGNVNLYSLENLASISLNDEEIIGRSLIRSFYGRGPDFSYWNGCSQGGRQGLMLAQWYPTAYDGIAAGAPAIYWAEFVASIQWPQQFMNMLGSYPHGCELDAISTAAISACDELDGVVDGVVAHVGACLAGFDPFGLVGTEINCPGIDGQIRISAAAAAVANATWHGMSRADGRQTWCGFSPGADLTGNSPSSNGLPGVAATNCTDGACIGASNILGLQWLQLFVAKDPDFSSGNLTHAEFDSLIHASKEQFKSIINTDDPDLSEFRSAGGKMSAFTGCSNNLQPQMRSSQLIPRPQADNTIPPMGTERYYKAVAALLPDVHDFYRHYEVPGLGHCYGGPSGQPSGLFAQLRAWVENGTAPGQSPIELRGLDGGVHDRIV